jgi:hypothetical protein
MFTEELCVCVCYVAGSVMWIVVNKNIYVVVACIVIFITWSETAASGNRTGSEGGYCLTLQM